eukprot:CAMPEP_0184966804 /NCGR_PEP_ID=MMETSP1098-20130426/370_1 /TAXON_ID=89044 /ORGANISM="Spumella elongata, Strain CCAP 955/1" /LENGTH=518 /DNA_ID=CAMNT_0027488147 /DNA_START=100 /DNA_END=1656 /DNA_ORIENTATION=+
MSTSFSEIVALKGDPKTLAKRLPLAKIVATIGPASENLPMLSHVMNAGMRLMRINFSHATYEEADLRVGNLKKCFGVNHADGKLVNGQANMRAVMLDTQGPEIRTGSFGGSTKEVELFIGQQITLTNDPAVRTNQTADRIWISYQKLQSTVTAGSRILLDDGAVEVEVLSKGTQHGEIVCKVNNQGVLGNKKGVNMPGLAVELPAMCDKDKVDIRWGIQNDIDYIAASFVRKASDVTEIREYTAQLMKELYPTSTPVTHPLPHVISKIESVEALVNFDSILEVSDAIMVARGDLAVEIPMETLANVQKEIVRRCNVAGKPVIVATQMLESMQKNPRPTRAECTDVANAIFDGGDCVMLSGESAKGRYPVETVSLMNRIVAQSELAQQETNSLIPRPVPSVENPLQSVAYAAAQQASSLREHAAVSSIVVPQHATSATTDSIAKFLSGFRPHLPVFVMVSTHKQGRQLQAYKNLHPIFVPQGVDGACNKQVLTHLRTLGVIGAGDEAILVTEKTVELTA